MTEFPDMMSAKCKEIFFKLDEFDYEHIDASIHEDDRSLPYYGPVQLSEDVFYIGQFKNKLRHGKGK